jgi:ankyrin repeat protein
MVTRLIKQQEQLDPNQVQGLVNTKTKDGRSVLSGACKFGHNKIVDELVKGGAQIKEDKALPLSLAVGQCNLDICRKLLAQGASFQDCSSIDKSKHLVNMIMSNRSKEDQKRIVSLLLTGDSNIPVNSQSIDKQVVHDAIAQVLKDPKGQYEDIKLLVDTFDVTLPEVLSTDGKSLTVLALEKGDLALFDTLIKNTNPSLNDTSNFLKIALDGIRVQERAQRNKEDKYKPDLHVALVSRAKEWIEDNPALSNQSFDDGTTPLMRAAESGHVGTAELIIKKGAEINTVKSSANSTKIHEPESTLMAFALRSKSNEMIAFLAGKEVDLTLTDSKGLTPMQSIVSSSRPTFSEVMMLKGSKQDLQIKDDNDNTLLHLLVNRSGADKSLDLIRELLKAGLDPCQKNKEGVSPIQMALGTDKTQKNIPVVVAMMESMSAKTLSQDDVLRESLKPHKSEILECFKSSFKDTDLNSSASKVAATDRLKQVFDLKNALGHLYRTKIRIDKPGPEDKMTPQSLVGRFHLDNKVMKELKGFKASFLDEGEKKRTFEITRPKQWRNL